MKLSTMDLVAHLTTLGETPMLFRAVASGRSRAYLALRPRPDAWSPVEILAHLRACQEVWGYSIYAMLHLEHVTLADLNPRDWAASLGYAELPFSVSLGEYQAQREALLGELAALKAASWHRKAFIGQHHHSVYSQVRRMALHEAAHRAQIEAI